MGLVGMAIMSMVILAGCGTSATNNTNTSSTQASSSTSTSSNTQTTEQTGLKKEIIGTWSCTITEHSGTQKQISFTFKEDGTFTKTVTRGGNVQGSHTSTYTIEGENRVVLQSNDKDDDDDDDTNVLTYSDGKLSSGSKVFTKQ